MKIIDYSGVDCIQAKKNERKKQNKAKQKQWKKIYTHLLLVI